MESLRGHAAVCVGVASSRTPTFHAPVAAVRSTATRAAWRHVAQPSLVADVVRGACPTSTTMPSRPRRRAADASAGRYSSAARWSSCRRVAGSRRQMAVVVRPDVHAADSSPSSDRRECTDRVRDLRGLRGLGHEQLEEATTEGSWSPSRRSADDVFGRSATCGPRCCAATSRPLPRLRCGRPAERSRAQSGSAPRPGAAPRASGTGRRVDRRACGAISSARPPVAIAGASAPSSPRIAVTMPSTWPAKP